MKETWVPIISAGSFILLFVIERFRPLRRERRPLRHFLYNGTLTIGLLVTALIFVRPAVKFGFNWVESQEFGLMGWLTWSVGLEVVVSFLLLDLSFYYWHRINHRLSFLWRFHNVHHVDPELDVTTALRFHFAEVALSSVFRFVQVALIGPSLAVYVIFEVVFMVSTFFHHSNIRLPEKFERYLNILIVTPRMHSIHHSQSKEDADSNFSVVFRLWDSLHDTFRQRREVEKIKIGVPAYSINDNRLWSLISMPFKRQKSYWQV